MLPVAADSNREAALLRVAWLVFPALLAALMRRQAVVLLLALECMDQGRPSADLEAHSWASAASTVVQGLVLVQGMERAVASLCHHHGVMRWLWMQDSEAAAVAAAVALLLEEWVQAVQSRRCWHRCSGQCMLALLPAIGDELQLRSAVPLVNGAVVFVNCNCDLMLMNVAQLSRTEIVS